MTDSSTNRFVQRPRTAIQYLIEDAIEQYLNRAAEEGGPVYQIKPASKAKKKS